MENEVDENSFEEKIENLLAEKYELKCVYRKPMGRNTVVLSFVHKTAYMDEFEKMLDDIQKEEFIRNSDASAYTANIAGSKGGPAIQIMFDED